MWEDYGLREFVRNVAADIDHRCAYCYGHRLEGAARYAAEHGFPAFTSTLLASTYQDHDAIANAAAHWGEVYGVADERGGLVGGEVLEGDEHPLGTADDEVFEMADGLR